ncbi:TonB family protein [Rhodobacteraceae bacterium KMM 6894]|nr:TonB family protein [Rhodobacteraceae bacterium KMM 6894]
MTRSSGIAKTVALSLAVATHGALALALVLPDGPRIEGADGASEVRLGNAFQDMAAGTLAPDHSDTVAQTTPPDTTPAQQHAETPPATPDTTIESDHADLIQPVSPAVSPPVLTPKIAEPAIVAPTVPDGVLTPTKRVTPPPEQTAVLTAEQTPEILESTEADSDTVTRSLRPKVRSAKFEAAHKPAPAVKPTPKPKAQPAARAKSSAGNAKENARAGEASGKADATARHSGTAGRSQAAGNAAISNYPGLVMRRLSRAGKPRVNARGAAVVAFTVSASGGVASAGIARSSGSSALDKAAVRLVRGAGPFPKPPQGARRSFSVEIKGR